MKRKEYSLASLIFVIAFLFMLTMFLNVLKIVDLDSYIRGSHLVFGTKEPLFTIFGFGISLNLQASFLHFIVYFLPLILSIALVIISVTMPKFYLVKAILSFVLLLVFAFGVYFFFNLASYSFNETIYNALNTLGMQLAIGAVLAIILLSFGMVFSLINTAFELKK